MRDRQSAGLCSPTYNEALAYTWSCKSGELSTEYNKVISGSGQ